MRTALSAGRKIGQPCQLKKQATQYSTKLLAGRLGVIIFTHTNNEEDAILHKLIKQCYQVLAAF